MTYDAYYSDPHFGHAKIIEYASRPFRDAEHQTRELISRYNAAVRPDDIVLWLGDCSLLPPADFAGIMSELNGFKHLVAGNHDRYPRIMLGTGFDLVVPDRLHLQIGDWDVVACHYPPTSVPPHPRERFMERRPKLLPTQACIHGHTHDLQRMRGRAIHVGVDAWAYKPAAHEQVSALIDTL